MFVCSNANIYIRKYEFDMNFVEFLILMLISIDICHNHYI